MECGQTLKPVKLSAGVCLFSRHRFGLSLGQEKRERPQAGLFCPLSGRYGAYDSNPCPYSRDDGAKDGDFFEPSGHVRVDFRQERQGGRPSGKVCRRKKKKIRHALTAFLDKRGATGSGLGSFNSCLGLFNNCVSPRSLVSSGSRWVSTQPWRRSGLWARDTSRGARRRPAIVPARGATWCRSRRG